MAWPLPLHAVPPPSGTAVLPLVIVLLLAVATVALVLFVLRRLRR